MATRNAESGSRSSDPQSSGLQVFSFSYIQFQFPPPFAVPLVAPQLERADFGHAAFERDRREIACLTSAVRGQRHLERPDLLEVVAPLLDQRAGPIVLADR